MLPHLILKLSSLAKKEITGALRSFTKLLAHLQVLEQLECSYNSILRRGRVRIMVPQAKQIEVKLKASNGLLVESTTMITGSIVGFELIVTDAGLLLADVSGILAALKVREGTIYTRVTEILLTGSEQIKEGLVIYVESPYLPSSRVKESHVRLEALTCSNQELETMHEERTRTRLEDSRRCRQSYSKLVALTTPPVSFVQRTLETFMMLKVKRSDEAESV